jgi:hypothetical protein
LQEGFRTSRKDLAQPASRRTDAITLDENLPADLIAELAVLGHDMDTAAREGTVVK